MKSENKKHLNWPLAIAEYIIFLKHGNICSVKVHTKSKLFLRLNQNVYPVEAQDVSYSFPKPRRYSRKPNA